MWVLHASSEWSEEHLEDEPDTVLASLIDAFWQATGTAPKAPTYATSHRWRYAIPVEPLESLCLFDSNRRIGACGDWCGGPRVEGAFLSGVAMAGHVLAHLGA